MFIVQLSVLLWSKCVCRMWVKELLTCWLACLLTYLLTYRYAFEDSM